MVCIALLTKKPRRNPLIQKPYHIKVSLQEYYEKFEEWTIPDFSDKCLICGGADCAGYHGHYTRTATCPLTGFSVPDFPVMRFLCQGKGDKRKCDHVTFSLLPIELVPFQQLTLKFMILAVWIKLGRHLSFTRSLDAIEEELNALCDIAEFINISTLMSWERLIRAAFKLFLSTDMYTLRQFIRMNSISKQDIDEFVKAVSGKGLSIRDIELLAYGFFRGSDDFRQLIKKGNITWGLNRLKGIIICIYSFSL